MLKHNNFKKFIFDDFIITSDGTLIRDKNKIQIPPKEFAVLVILLQSSGVIVSKNLILDSVWGQADVYEESLTRCIYSLRKILSISKYSTNNYIETIYGKGYRFNRTVIEIKPDKIHEKKIVLAIFPFYSNTSFDTFKLHHNIIEDLYDYHPLTLSVLPATLTQNCLDTETILSTIKNLNPSYYLTGHIFNKNENENHIKLELIEKESHTLIYSDTFHFTDKKKLKEKIIFLLFDKIQELKPSRIKLNVLDSLDSAVIYINGVYMLFKFTIESLKKAVLFFSQCISINPNNSLPYYGLAEAYLSMALFGFFDKKKSIMKAKEIISKIIKINPNNPLSLALLGVSKSIDSDFTTGEILLKQAIKLNPNSADLNYYYCWHLLLKGNLNEACHYIEKCTEIIPTKNGANILKVWLYYCNYGVDRAMILAEQLKVMNLKNNIIFDSMLALFYSQTNKKDFAMTLIDEISKRDDLIGFAKINIYYSRYSIKGNSETKKIKNYILNIGNKIPRAMLLPLIKVSEGERVAFDLYSKLKNENNIWLNIWGADPRVLNYKNNDAS